MCLLVLAVKVHAETRSIGEDTIVLVVTDRFQDAVFCARLLVGAHGWVWSTAPIAAAFGRVVLLVDWVGASVKNHVAFLSFAASLLGAFIGSKLGLSLLALAKGLRCGNTQKSRRKNTVVNHNDRRLTRTCVIVQVLDKTSLLILKLCPKDGDQVLFSVLLLACFGHYTSTVH